MGFPGKSCYAMLDYRVVANHFSSPSQARAIDIQQSMEQALQKCFPDADRRKLVDLFLVDSKHMKSPKKWKEHVCLYSKDFTVLSLWGLLHLGDYIQTYVDALQ